MKRCHTFYGFGQCSIESFWWKSFVDFISITCYFVEEHIRDTHCTYIHSKEIYTIGSYVLFYKFISFHFFSIFKKMRKPRLSNIKFCWHYKMLGTINIELWLWIFLQFWIILFSQRKKIFDPEILRSFSMYYNTICLWRK